ncbi:MAG: hypothetical protein GXO62_07325 [Epsilonproteobacteria bacterium]|nr:hypothetical protein [Campylobacterota bacterium]
MKYIVFFTALLLFSGCCAKMGGCGCGCDSYDSGCCGCYSKVDNKMNKKERV